MLGLIVKKKITFFIAMCGIVQGRRWRLLETGQAIAHWRASNTTECALQ